MIANITSNKNLYPEGTDFSIRVWKHNISFAFVTESLYISFAFVTQS